MPHAIRLLVATFVAATLLAAPGCAERHGEVRRMVVEVVSLGARVGMDAASSARAVADPRPTSK